MAEVLDTRLVPFPIPQHTTNTTSPPTRRYRLTLLYDNDEELPNARGNDRPYGSFKAPAWNQKEGEGRNDDLRT